jgi:hypothetical protein
MACRVMSPASTEGWMSMVNSYWLQTPEHVVSGCVGGWWAETSLGRFERQVSA